MFNESFKSLFAFTVIVLISQFDLIQFYCLIYMVFSTSVRVAIGYISNLTIITKSQKPDPQNELLSTIWRSGIIAVRDACTSEI